MKIRIVIPTHGRPALLRRTLDSLAACQLPPGFDGILVVENGGKDGAEAICSAAAEHLRTSYLYHETGNKSAALNCALEETGDELLIFLDDDVRLEPETLCAYARAAAETPRGAFFGGPIQPEFEVPPVPWIRLPYSATGWSLPDETREVDSPDFLGFNWAARAVDLCAAGGFNPAVGPGGTTGGRGQESEMQRRLLHSGLTGIYVADAMVWHYVPTCRCTVEWSINRAYQGGISSALLREPGELVSRTLRSASGRARACLLATVRLSRPIGYSLQLERSWWSGYLLGCCYLIRQKARPQNQLKRSTAAAPAAETDSSQTFTAEPESLVA